SGLESFYDAQSPGVISELLKEMVNAVSNEAAPFHLSAPAGLLANLAKKENCLVLHLTNWTGNKFEKPWRNEYYLAPVENVTLQIHIPDGKKIKKVSTIVEANYDKRIRGQ